MQWSLIKDNIVTDIILSDDEEFVKNYAKENHYEYVSYKNEPNANMGYIRDENGNFKNPEEKPVDFEIQKGLPKPISEGMKEI